MSEARQLRIVIDRDGMYRVQEFRHWKVSRSPRSWIRRMFYNEEYVQKECWRSLSVSGHSDGWVHPVAVFESLGAARQWAKQVRRIGTVYDVDETEERT